MSRPATSPLLSALLLSTGCADSSVNDGAGGSGGEGGGGAGGSEYLEGALEIRGAVQPDSECTYTTELDPAHTEGSWDLAASSDYFLGLVVENTLGSRIIEELQGELNGIQVSSVQITLLRPDGTPREYEQRLPNPYSVPASALVPVADGEQPSLELALVTAMPMAFAEPLADASTDELTAELQAVGSLADGTRVRSQPFLWPLRLCDGCLAQQCANSGPPEGSCTPGQDGDPWCGP
jgi:hypothetical protein